jgi:acetoin utilization deacetylase AcuC-like enzyme
MLPFKLVCAPTFYLPIGQSVFPVSKYRLTYERLLEQGIAGREDFVAPAPASDEDILLVHTPEYVRKLRTGTLSESEEWQLEARYSLELVEAKIYRLAKYYKQKGVLPNDFKYTAVVAQLA